MIFRATKRAKDILWSVRYWSAYVGGPFHLPAGNASQSDTRRRKTGRQLILERRPILFRPVAAALMLIFWPIAAFLLSRNVVRRAPDAIRYHGRQGYGVWRIWFYAVRYNHFPIDVVQYDMLAPDAFPDSWINDREMSLTWGKLNSNAPRRLLDDKVRFADFCRDIGLPTPCIFERWEDGNKATSSSEPWPDSFVEKPVLGSVGRGVKRWTKVGDVYTDGTSVLSTTQMQKRFAKISRTKPLILQEEVQQHEFIALSGITGSPVARIMTGRWPNGAVELLGAYLSLPEPNQFASNIGFGHELPIELFYGKILPSRAFWPSVRCSPLPSTVPYWQKATRLACSAHLSIPGRMVAIGWDVVFGLNGPVFLEGNYSIGFYKLQRATQKPASESPLGDLLDQWLSEENRSH
jgi:hypothetical protein